MFYRIFGLSFVTMFLLILGISSLQADYKKANLRQDFARKKVIDGDERNPDDLDENNPGLYAEAYIEVDLDDRKDLGEKLQPIRTEFKTYGRIKGIAPNDQYDGYWYVDLNPFTKSRYVPEAGGVAKWWRKVDKDFRKNDEWLGDEQMPPLLRPPALYLLNCTATASISGGDNLWYHYENSIEPTYTADLAYAEAYDFSHEEADEWFCYNCTDNEDLDTPCSKCGGEDVPPDDDVGRNPDGGTEEDDTEADDGEQDGDTDGEQDGDTDGDDDTNDNGDDDDENDGDDEEASTPPAVFRPSLSLRYNSSTGSVRLIATAKVPIFGADLYVRFPGDTSKYGTKIGWTSGNSNRTPYSLPVNYSFPASAASGRYKFTLRVYPFNNSGSGNAWGDPYDVFKFVTVE